MASGMGEMRNIGNIDIGKYHIGFWNCKIDIGEYCIEILSLIPVEPVQNRHIKNWWYNIFLYKMQLVPIRENIELYQFCLLLSDWYWFFTHCTNFWLLNKISWVFFLPMFSRSQNVTISLHILLILNHWKARLWMLNRLKSDITNVESVKKWYYKCWIGLKPIFQMLNQFKVLLIWNCDKTRNLRLVPI